MSEACAVHDVSTVAFKLDDLIVGNQLVFAPNTVVCIAIYTLAARCHDFSPPDLVTEHELPFPHNLPLEVALFAEEEAACDEEDNEQVDHHYLHESQDGINGHLDPVFLKLILFLLKCFLGQ